jgi:hypothetical protein
MAFMTYSDVPNILQSQTFFPYRYRHPQRTLIIFKSVSGDPGGAARKLDAIQQNKNITKVCLIEKPRKWRKIWLVGG